MASQVVYFAHPIQRKPNYRILHSPNSKTRGLHQQDLRILVDFATMGRGIVVKMRQEQIDEVLRVLDDVMQQAGAPGGYAEVYGKIQDSKNAVDPEKKAAAQIGMVVAETLAAMQGGPSLNELLAELKGLPTRAQLAASLVEAPDLSSADLELLDNLKKLPTRVRKSVIDIAREIKPKGGPPTKVPRSEYSKICDKIASNTRTMTLGQAKAKVASEYGCGASTINKAWRSRTASQPSP